MSVISFAVSLCCRLGRADEPTQDADMHCQFSNAARGHLLCEPGQSKFPFYRYVGILSLLPCCSCSLWNTPFSTYRDPKLTLPDTVQSCSLNQTNLVLSSELSTGKCWHAALLQGVHSLSLQVPEFLNQE